MTATSHTLRPEFDQKRALVTGGTQGIGKAIALRLARSGAQVFLNYAHDNEVARATLAEFRAEGLVAELLEADLSSPSAVDRMIELLHRDGPIDLFVGNAAYQEKQRGLFKTDLALMERTFAVNLFANLRLVQSIGAKLIAAGRSGRMVLCSSGHGARPYDGTLAYGVSKAALNHFVRYAAVELIEHDIRLNGVDIGWTHTPGERRWFSEQKQNELATTIPIGRAALADEIAAVLEFLLSEQASYVVGSLYLADGGTALRPNAEKGYVAAASSV